MAKEKKPKREDVIQALLNEPNQTNWNRAQAKISKEGKYYFIFYPNGVSGETSLLAAHAVIYGADHKVLYKVPIVEMKGKKIHGATIRLKGLEINRKMIK